jgi:hypothetical protein
LFSQDQLSELLPKENRGPVAPRWFSSAGMFGLMFLKSYLKISDKKLIERFNTNWRRQIFCGKFLKDGEKFRKNGIVSRIRTYLAEYVDFFLLQEILIRQWKRDMNNTHVLLMDATSKNIFTNFPKKGPKINLPQESNLRKILSAARAAIMEESFGPDLAEIEGYQHYL